MQNLQMLKGQFPKNRFWELFSPCTITFGFWLATASFCFFAYQSLLPPNMEGIMSWTAGVLSAAFFIFGIACMLVVFYLFITWVAGIRITRKKTKSEGMSIKAIRRNLQQEYSNMPSTATIYEWIQKYTQYATDSINSSRAANIGYLSLRHIQFTFMDVSTGSVCVVLDYRLTWPRQPLPELQ